MLRARYRAIDQKQRPKPAQRVMASPKGLQQPRKKLLRLQKQELSHQRNSGLHQRSRDKKHRIRVRKDIKVAMVPENHRQEAAGISPVVEEEEDDGS